MVRIRVVSGSRPTGVVAKGEVTLGKEEKMLILQMVSDGQITPEQGVELLKALEPAKGHAPTGRVEIGDALRQRVDEIARRAEETAERAGKRAEEIGEDIGESVSKRAGEIAKDAEVVGSIAENIGKAISQMFAGGFSGGSRFEFKEEIKGEFPEDGELEVSLRTSNGRIMVESWDEPGYLLTVTKQVRAQDEDEAKQALENCYDFRQDGLSLEARTGNGLMSGLRNTSVAFFLKIPAPRKVSLSLGSANGRITSDGVFGSKCAMNTANGRIQVLRCDFDETRLRTANGRIEYEGGAKQLDAVSANGRIDVQMKGAGDWRFNSANGRIEVEVREQDEAAYEVDLASNLGRIDVEGMDDAEILVNETRAGGRRRYKARSRGFESAKVKGHIKASTSVGRIGVWF